VLTVATTGDVDDNDFAIASGNTGTAFAINAASGAITTAAALDYETTPSYTLGITVSDGDATSSVSVTVTITDVNDQTPAVSVASTYSHAEATATTFQTYTITDSDTAGTYTCTLGGDDAADFSASISAKVCTVVWAAAPNYESPADTGANNVYDITIAFSDGTNDLSAQTTAVTVTDVNAQPPAVSVASTYSQAEATATTFQTYTITDSDTTGTYTCTLAGDDAADFSASISAKVCTVVWAAAPDYESPADTGVNNVYDITIAVSDGTNAGRPDHGDHHHRRQRPDTGGDRRSDLQPGRGGSHHLAGLHDGRHRQRGHLRLHAGRGRLGRLRQERLRQGLHRHLRGQPELRVPGR